MIIGRVNRKKGFLESFLDSIESRTGFFTNSNTGRTIFYFIERVMGWEAP